MFTPQQKIDFGVLRAEVVDLNILAHCFVRKLNRFGYLFQNTSRHHMYEEFTASRYMENGLILHLTKLDDDAGSSSYSFRGAVKELNKSKIDERKKTKLNKLLSDFRQDLNNLKTNHRNIRVAHLNRHVEMQLDQFLNFDKEFNPLIKQANEINDLIWGEKIEYGFKLGKYLGILDFRKLTEDLKVDSTKEQSW